MYNELSPMSYQKSPSTLIVNPAPTNRRIVDVPVNAHRSDRVGALLCGGDVSDNRGSIPGSRCGTDTPMHLRNPNVESDHAESERKHPFWSSHVRHLVPVQHAETPRGRRKVAEPTGTAKPQGKKILGTSAQGSDETASLTSWENATPPTAGAGRGPPVRGPINPLIALQREIAQFSSNKHGGLGMFWVKLLRGEFLPVEVPTDPVSGLPRPVSASSDPARKKRSEIPISQLAQQLSNAMQKPISSRYLAIIMDMQEEDMVKHADFVRVFTVQYAP